MITNGLVCKFNARGLDSAWSTRNGQTCTVIRPLTADEADLSDVGPMYRIRFEDGVNTIAFEDELSV